MKIHRISELFRIKPSTVREKIYKDTQLTKEFLDFISNWGCKDNLPLYDNNANYRMDWSIIGLEWKILFNHFDALRVFTPVYRQMIKRYGPISTSQEREVTNWLNYVSVKLFTPERMMLRYTTHNDIIMRICVSKLDKLSINKEIKDRIFDNLLVSYKKRLLAYNQYFNLEILDLPF